MQLTYIEKNIRSALGKIKYGLVLTIIFAIVVVGYGVFVTLFSSPVHVGVDEELYISMARTFHYEGKFMMGGELLNYNCVLYSMLISLAYYFYSPERIMLIIRLIGVILMCSSVYPIGLLAYRVLKDKRKAVFITVVLSMMPYMFDVAYAMQEVLSYPLFCWLVLFLYELNDKDSNHNTIACILIISVISVFLVYTKTYLFCVPIIINVVLIKRVIKDRNEILKTVRMLILYDVMYIIGVVGIYWGIYAINGFQRGTNHYSTQISGLFPITISTILCGISCCVVYIGFFVVCTGLLPFISVCSKQDNCEHQDGELIDFHVFGVFILVVEIVFMIIITEMGLNPLPGKFLFRYFQVFVPGIMILALKRSGENYDGRKIILWCEISLIICLIYFLFENGISHNAIIDGHIFLLIENISRNILPHFNVIITVVTIIAAPIVGRLLMKGHNQIRIICGLLTVAILTLFIVQWIQLPYYTNIIAKGREIQQDSISIAHFLNDNNIDNVYYIQQEEENPYLRNFYGAIKQDYIVCSSDTINKYIDTSKRSVYIVPKLEGEIDSRFIERDISLHNYRLFIGNSEKENE